MNSLSFEYVDALQFVKLGNGAAKAQSGLALHETQLGVDIPPPVGESEGVPTSCFSLNVLSPREPTIL